MFSARFASAWSESRRRGTRMYIGLPHNSMVSQFRQKMIACFLFPRLLIHGLKLLLTVVLREGKVYSTLYDSGFIYFFARGFQHKFPLPIVQTLFNKRL